MLILYLILTFAFLAVAEAAMRQDVVVTGTTIGPGFVRTASQGTLKMRI